VAKQKKKQIKKNIPKIPSTETKRKQKGNNEK